MLDDLIPIGLEETPFACFLFSAALLGVALRLAARTESSASSADAAVAARPGDAGHAMPRCP